MRLHPAPRKAYLAGPIIGCTDAECNDWRRHLTNVLQKYNIEVLDPMRRDYRGRRDECYTEIVEQDKADIDAADIVIVRYFRPSVGTSMEMLYAWERKKLVILWADQGIPLSPWLTYHCHINVFSSTPLVRILELLFPMTDVVAHRD
jgi:nucleoside 2-deoxyribosyltransferase